MKAKLKLACIAIVVMLGLSLGTKAQTFPLQNFTNCDVDIYYEMWDAACNVCAFGPVNIPAGSPPINLSVCSTPFEICLIITDVGGCPVSVANHASLSTCHFMTAYGQSGATSGTCCNGMPTTWVASHTPAGWSIW